MNRNRLSQKAQEVFEQMTEAEWKNLRIRLLYFAHKNYGRICHHFGYEPEEIVQDAFVDVLTGVRLWPPVDEHGKEKEVSLLVFLCNTIRSKVSHSLKKRRREISLSDLSSSLISADRLLAEQLQSKKETADGKVAYDEFSRRLISAVSNDAILTKIVQLLVEVPDLRPREIALILNLSIEQTRNAQKRLIRRARMLKRRDNE